MPEPDAIAELQRLGEAVAALTPPTPSVEALAEALPQHRYHEDDIAGHEGCLRIARVQWANLRRTSEA